MAKPRRRISTQWCVHTGRPSWHQQKAGHISAASGCYWRKKDALKYIRNFKRHHPNEPVFMTSSRQLRKWG